ncbi:tetratricopeptide repeat protein [Marinilabiliaceae bacterium ANBcel2]|nr:tetratricopeptide repeat protein [Marinilabiliaceae bacterium ANBcel2]
MRKLLVVAGFVMFAIGGVLAQDVNHAQLRNEGNEALRENNYADALDLYEQSLEAQPDDEEVDPVMVFNMATCARRDNQFEKAFEYYSMAADLGYRADFSTYYIAASLNRLGREEEMEEVLLQALEDYETSSVAGHMRRLLTNYYLKKGAEPFNRASEILATAENADPSEYDEIEARANEEFKKAKPWFEKVLEVDPNNSNAQASMQEINSRLE